MARLGRMGSGLLTVMLLVWPPAADATPITLYVEPNNVYQNTENNPCIFYGNHDGSDSRNSCPKDPAGWLYPVGQTGSQGSGVLRTLEQTYSFAEWDAFVGSLFVVGFDVNDTSSSQTLDYFQILFDGVLAYEYSPSSYPPTGPPVPAPNNGNGWADYLIAAGCLSPQDVSGGFDYCDTANLLPFIVPTGTTSLTFRMQYFANDGGDQVFAITEACPQGVNCSPVFPPSDPPLAHAPEPASVLLLGAGLFGMGAFLKKRRSRRK